MRHHLKFFILSLLLTSCVSVELPSNKASAAKDVQYAEPPVPFTSIKSKNADKTWISSKTGNTISYLSECGGSDSTLKQLEDDSLSALNNQKTLKEDSFTYNGREAHQVVTSGDIDGVPVQMALLVFKKNNCNYTLTYGGLKKQYAAEQKIFDVFKDSFKAP